MSKTHAQTKLLLKPIFGLQKEFSSTNFQKSNSLIFGNNVRGKSIFPSLMLVLTKKNKKYYISIDQRSGAYSYSAAYKSLVCGAQYFKIQSTASEYMSTSAGVAFKISEAELEQDYHVDIVFSTGFSLLVTKYLNYYDYESTVQICSDILTFRPKLAKLNKIGFGIPLRFDFDIYKKEKPILSFALSYLKGFKGLTYYDNEITVNTEVYKNQFINRGTTFALGIGIPITIKK